MPLQCIVMYCIQMRSAVVMELEVGDVRLLCSDGLWEQVSNSAELITQITGNI
ncbi:hypothetical protein F7734_32730 [Scytonema sp. UIC 10036]|uniref:hypothetical protein n=1 Tax=Scytonema sp. UIC 10036 TaxID=2304196 RepID=UPI0012DA3802|nr:hypothetical protein [Scytonema sp. UIC 10036]MUG96852.1 hypothetical protein [Scytonema sp. UIC 10036]